MSSTTTLDALWKTLGLDSLPGDVGSATDLRATHGVDWAAATLRVTRDTPTERVDLPRISTRPPLESGTSVQDLIVVGVLGEGGMGKVLLSHQQSLGRDVAVKVARPDASPGTLQALVHEARTTGALEHPGVIPVYALASDVDGRPALVMKRVDGVAWSRLIYDAGDPAWAALSRPGQQPLERHVDVLVQVCNAIAYAHHRGYLHRDIKPSNILIGEFGEVFVADWGVATRKFKKGDPLRKPSLVGTPVYLAPEMATGDDSHMDERTDVFLLGATLFEVLAGRPPYGGADLREVLERVWEGKHEPMPADAPRDLVELCEQAMAMAPASRFQTVTEFRDALLDWGRHRGSVSLALASQTRLERMQQLLAKGERDRAVMTPLLSECRFGFSQSLAEWPENGPARTGLHASIEAAARFEISLGQLDAARALCRELDPLPPSLAEALATLEASVKAAAVREARLRHLEKELDPKVSGRQRVAFFIVMALSTVIIVSATRSSDVLRGQLERFGAFGPAMVMVMFLVAYIVGLWVGRQSLLSTRINRRAAGVLGLAILGPMANRFAAGFTGPTHGQMLVSDMLITATMTTAAGLMLHWGFFVAAGIYGCGVMLAIVWPQFASVIHGIVAVISIAAVLLSWGRWRSELGGARPNDE
jgi:serine/threonine-protein kinase